MKTTDLMFDVLMAVAVCQPRATGYTIQQYLHRTRRRRWWFGPGPGVIYPALIRLEHLGLIESAWGPMNAPNSRPRFYHLAYGAHRLLGEASSREIDDVYPR